MARARPAATASGRRRGASPRAASRTAGWARGLAGAERPALLLLGLWVAYRLYPFSVTLNPLHYWHAIRPVLLDPLPHDGDPVRWCLSWLLACMLIEAVSDAARAVRLFPIFAGAVLLARVVIGGAALSSGEVAGATVAWVFWLLLFRRLPGRHAILALFIAALTAAQHLPLLSGAAPGWARGLGVLHGTGLALLLEKLFVYGGLIWLLNRAGMRLLFATLAAMLLVLATALARTQFVAGPAQMIDALVAAAAGGLLFVAAMRLPGRR
jgi:hypothetical protein